MKKLISFCFMFMIVSIAAFATIDVPSSAVGVAVTNSGSIFKLYYKDIKNGDVNVSILNAKRLVIYKETIEDVDGFIRPYNFNNLKSGYYTIEVTAGGERYTETVHYVKGTLEKLNNVALNK